MTTKTAKRPPTYPPKVVAFARRMYDRGYSPYRIHKALKAKGCGAAEDTIRCWCDPAYAESRALRKRNGRGYQQERQRGFKRRWARMVELRETVALSYRAIAALMSNDFEDVDLSTDQVRAIFNGETSQATIRRLLWPAGEAS